MLTKEEEYFLAYWKEQRLRKKQFLKKFSIGLPLAVGIAAALLINLLSGWYKKAMMELNSDSSVMIVILIALLAIVVFITVFSAHHRWDRNETLYQELLKKKDAGEAAVQQVSEN
jgi:predicted PurR-regulated permease PerM